jgi:hypothetical protein
MYLSAISVDVPGVNTGRKDLSAGCAFDAGMAKNQKLIAMAATQISCSGLVPPTVKQDCFFEWYSD